MLTQRSWQRLAILLFVLGAAPTLARSASTREPSLAQIADEAYLYGYPLMLMAQVSTQLANIAQPGQLAAPMNQFAHQEAPPDPAFKTLVRPRVDAIQTTAFIDLTREPLLLHLPDSHGRYILLSLFDAYTNVFSSLGTRTTGVDAQDLIITGPGWLGSIPSHFKRIEAPTRLVWIIARTEVLGHADLPKAAAFARQYSLIPISHFNGRYSPPKNPDVNPRLPMGVSPAEIIARLSETEYFTELSALLAKFPPAFRDNPAVYRFARIGLKRGSFTPSLEALRAMSGAAARARQRMASYLVQSGKTENGWNIATDLGEYGTRYVLRAAVAQRALVAALPQDEIAPERDADAEGQPLTGDRAYVLHFDPGQDPPLHGFWSVTLYDPQGYLVPNSIGRYALGGRDPLQRNPDGSLDLWIQSTAPEGAMQNWLPAPPGPFTLVFRLYWPNPEILNGSWQPPALRRVPPETAEGNKARPSLKRA